MSAAIVVVAARQPERARLVTENAMMRHRVIAIGTMLTVAAGGTAAAAGSAQAAYDTQPPLLTTPIKAHFVVGTRMHQFRDSQEGHAYYNVPMRFAWSATDNVDTQLNYDVWEYPQGAAPDRIGDFITGTSFDVTGSDYNGFFGGASLVIAHWSVDAYDDADNSTNRSVYGAKLLVTQDNGSQTFGSESPDVSVRYAGSWSTATCPCYADRTTHFTKTVGDAAVIRVVVPADETVRKVGLVMDEAARRGRARVLVDGVFAATIDTGVSSPTHKVVVWAGTLTAGAHHIRLVNLATPARPRIDFDAVVVN